MSVGALQGALVRFEVQQLVGRTSIGRITFNDPFRANALSEDMARAFREVVKQARKSRPMAITVTGAGRAFSSGCDRDMLWRKRRQSAAQNAAEMFKFYESFLGILDLNIPLIAAVNGTALGGGLCFACACDVRIAADIDENILGFSFAKLGLSPGMGGTIFPHRLVGDDKARDMLEKAYNITPWKAHEIKMVNEVVAPEELMQRTLEEAADIARSPDRVKQILSERVLWDQRIVGLEAEARRQGADFLSEQHRKLYPQFRAALRASRNPQMTLPFMQLDE